MDEWIKRISEGGMAVGGTLSLHHKLAYDRWEDEKLKCHGKIGKWTLLASLLIRSGYELYKKLEGGEEK